MKEKLQFEFEKAMAEVRFMDAYKIKAKIDSMKMPPASEKKSNSGRIVLSKGFAAAMRELMPSGKWLSTGINYSPTKLEMVREVNTIPLTSTDGTPVKYVGGKRVADFMTCQFDVLTILINDLEKAHAFANIPVFIIRNGKQVYNPETIVTIRGKNINVEKG